jgi:hypothetical protein
LRPLTFFPPVVAPLAARLRGLDALAVDDRGGRLGAAPAFLAGQLHQPPIHLFPGPVAGPHIEVVADRRPLREIMREQAPLAPRPRLVQEGVDHLAQVDGRGPARACGPLEMRFQLRPLLVGQVGRIRLAVHGRRSDSLCGRGLPLWVRPMLPFGLPFPNAL